MEQVRVVMLDGLLSYITVVSLSVVFSKTDDDFDERTLSWSK